MKNKKNLLAVLGIGILLFVACIVPTMVAVVEDEHLQSESKRYEIEEIRLNSGEADLTEKLSAIQEVLQDNVVVQKSQTELSQIQNGVDKNDVDKKAKEFLSVLNDNAEVNFIKFSAVLLVMADVDGDKVYSLWKCYAVDEDEGEYAFWIDEETEKVLAFEMPLHITEKNQEEFYKMAEKLAKYYGFTSGEITDKISVFLKLEYAETALRFIDEVEGTEETLMLYKNGNQLSFNMYPGQITFYDSASESH